MALSVLLAAWIAGALSGLHCAAMCGGFVAATVARDRRAAAPLLAARVVVRRQLEYHAGRILTYALLGASFGALGGATLLAVELASLQRAIYVFANAMLLLLGIGLVLRKGAARGLQRIGAGAFRFALPLLEPLLRRPGAAGRIALGLTWGLAPCALVYSMLPLALFAGGAWQGAAVMLAFGVGTLPNVVGAAVVIERAAPLLRGKSLRFAAAAVISGFALVGLYRALHAPETLASGPFCLTI